jgi:glycosyltransferase involved in cell wall biosynthesis
MQQPVLPVRKKIAIDARAISHPQRGGFKTYTENLVKHLLQVNVDYDYTLYFDRAMTNSPHSTIFNGVGKVVRTPGSLIGVPLREQVSLPYHFLADRIDLVHFPCATAAIWSPRPFVITVHDTIELMSMSDKNAGGSFKRNLMHLYNRYNQIMAIRRAAAIITVSQNSKKDIINYFKIPEGKIIVTYEAPDEMFVYIEDKCQLDEIRFTYQLENEYILGIGSADPRKNLSCMIQAYSQLNPELIARYQLVIVMTHNRLQESLFSLVEKLGLSQRVKFLATVSNQDLVFLYNGATLFVFPSLYEGFGLPLLEAMACGVPVVTANNSSIPEIAGGAARLVDGIEGKDGFTRLSAEMAKVLNDKYLQESLSHRGIERGKAFSWDKCAEETALLYRRTLHLIKN